MIMTNSTDSQPNFTPNSKEQFIYNGIDVEIPKCQTEFKKWAGITPSESFGRKPFLDYKGQPVFAEILVLKTMQDAGWQARWISTYGNSRNPKMLDNWTDGKYGEQIHIPIESEFVKSRLNQIVTANGGKYSGCWDVLAWQKDQIKFIELKRNKKDQIRQTQIKWLVTSLDCGFDLSDFSIVEWNEK